MSNPKADHVILYGIDGTDPVMVKRLVGEGKLPNFKRVMEQGFFTEALPSYSGKTPQNWTTIATGTEPGSHSITDLYVQKVGAPLKAAEKGGVFNGGSGDALRNWEEGATRIRLSSPRSPRTAQHYFV